MDVAASHSESPRFTSLSGITVIFFSTFKHEPGEYECISCSDTTVCIPQPSWLLINYTVSGCYEKWAASTTLQREKQMWDNTVSLETKVTGALCLIKHQAKKECEGVEVQRHALFIPAVGSVSFTPTAASFREKRLRTWTSNFFEHSHNPLCRPEI